MTKLDRTYAEWQACPVCGGRKTMPMGFYPGQTMATNTEQQCRMCFGLGSVMRPLSSTSNPEGSKGAGE